MFAKNLTPLGVKNILLASFHPDLIACHRNHSKGSRIMLVPDNVQN